MRELLRGIRAFFSGFHFILTTPGIWGFAAIPVVVATLLIGGFMTLGWAGKDAALTALPAETIRARAAATGLLGTTRYWTPEMHVGAFHLPPYIARHLPNHA